jgi:hypothetical protein
MNQESIKRAILKAAGNPESGVIFDLAEDIAKTIIEEHEQPKAKEQRVIIPTEIRKIEV